MRVADHHLDEVRSRGFTVVPDFLDPAALQAAQDALWDIYPKPDDYFSNPGAHERLVRTQFSGMRLFPYPSWALNRLAVHPDLVDVAERLCRTSDLNLYKVELWAKYSGGVDYDQPHHRDYGNHSLVVPKLNDDFMQVTTFILLSDVTELDGPTRVVPMNVTADLPFVPRELEKGAYQDQEIPITGRAGSLFVYRTEVLHRGSSMLGSHRSRFVMLVDFQPRGRPWTGKMAWPNHALSPAWVDAMVRMTPAQRSLFGFPAPGDDYWDAQTIRDVGLRYPGMDMSPYGETLA